MLDVYYNAIDGATYAAAGSGYCVLIQNDKAVYRE